MITWQLFTSFFKIGLFTIGGGYAMLNIIQEEITRYGWMTLGEFVDIVGIAEMTPGPLAVNAATFVGYRAGGFIGALSASTAVVLPSLLSVLIVSRFWTRYKNSKKVQAFFKGVRPVVAGLVAAAAVSVGRTSLEVMPSISGKILSTIVASLAFLGSQRKWSPIKILLASALVGLVIV